MRIVLEGVDEKKLEFLTSFVRDETFRNQGILTFHGFVTLRVVR